MKTIDEKMEINGGISLFAPDFFYKTSTGVTSSFYLSCQKGGKMKKEHVISRMVRQVT